MSEGAPGPERRQVSLGLFSVLASVQALFLALALLAIERVERPVLFTGLLALASVPWMWLAWLVFVEKRSIPVAWVLSAGLLLRLIGQLGGPSLSDDLYRYVWEGRMQLAGKNPYLLAPEHPSVRAPGDPVWERVNHREVPAAYPPVCQLYLRLLAATGGGVVWFRAGFALLDVLLLFLLAAWLARIGVDPGRSLVYALCPLVVVELGTEGHNDSLALFLLIAALALLGRAGDGETRASWTRISLVGVLYGASIAAKFLPGFLLPWLLRRDWRLLPACLVTVCLGYLPFLEGVERLGDLFEGLDQYATRWRANDSMFILIHDATASVQEWLKSTGSESWFATAALHRTSKVPLYAILLVGGLIVFLVEKEPGRVPAPMLALLFIVTPTLHPWYVCWVVPFLARTPSPALFVLVAGVPLSYHPLPLWRSQGEWVELPSYKLLEFAPFYGLLLLGILRRLRR
ncbi:MAG: hypothetical protein ACE5F1_08545 [Planctomycetota bacterium]